MSAPISDLQTLLRQMQPQLWDEPYLYLRLPDWPDPAQLQDLQPFALFAESEGISAVVSQARAAAMGLHGEGPFALISLRVHSSLQAVGLTAAIATALTDAGISANVIAALHHDHLLVPWSARLNALATLQALSSRTGASAPDSAVRG